jgi:hypothetical protein
MKLVKTASGKTTIRMTQKEWTDYGRKAGWLGKVKDFFSGEKKCPECSKEMNVTRGNGVINLNCECGYSKIVDNFHDPHGDQTDMWGV